MKEEEQEENETMEASEDAEEDEEIDSFELIRGEDEKILWQYKFPKYITFRMKQNHRKYAYLIILDILIYLIFSNFITIHPDVIWNFFLVFLIIQAPIMVFLAIIIVYLEDYYEYNNTEYYITNRRILLRYNASDPYWENDAFCALELEQIQKIEVIVDEKERNFSHILFFSDFIFNNPKDYYFYVKRDSVGEAERGIKIPVKGWLNTQDDTSLRFSYVKKTDEIIDILKGIISEKIIRKR